MLSFLLLLLLMRPGAASAGDCLVTAPPYQLQSDTVEWQMRTRVGQSCLRGIRLKLVANPTITIISPPRFGALSVQGPSFSYTPGTNFGDEDSFVLEVAGSIRKARGVSIIRVAVSNSDATDPRQDPALTPPTEPRLPLESRAPNESSLPPCPIWDWSKGSPPPMRPPFDTTKLHCPPPPFRPPNPPIGCICPE